jgi:hypothetical protein
VRRQHAPAHAPSAPSARERGERAGPLLFTISNNPERQTVGCPPKVLARYLLLAIRFFLSLFNSLLPTSAFPARVVSFAAPDEGRAERRWRSDACEAPVSARHDRRAVASLDQRRLGVKAGPMRSLRMAGEPGLRSISQTEQAQSE